VSSEPGWEALQLLAEPTRRALFQACREADAPLTREQLASALGVSRGLAAFHLDLLADAGLLTVDYARPAGRSGPGAGRPAKRYAPARVDLEVSVPPRRYDLVASILARGLASAGESGGDALQATLAVAHDEGERIGRLRRAPGRMTAAATTDAAADVLAGLGYEPRQKSAGCVHLCNCPFDSVVGIATDVVCGLNQRFVAGVLDGLGGHRAVEAVLDPAPDRCCVALTNSQRRR
jgi:predicted ArsR family transcriptional regulator